MENQTYREQQFSELGTNLLGKIMVRTDTWEIKSEFTQIHW